MKILIVSDIHANAESLRVLPADYDELWILGDLVNYGPSPVEVLDFARSKASLVVRGNHDHSVGFQKDSRCSARFRAMAEATGRWTRSVISEDDKQFLRELPTEVEREVNGVRFLLCHAVPSKPLYEYCLPEADRWRDEVSAMTADVLLAGHTHLSFQRKIDKKAVVNPGSLGQPKHGRAEACYAVWERSSFHLHAAPYAVDETIRKIQALPLPTKIQEDLSDILRFGGFAKLS